MDYEPARGSAFSGVGWDLRAVTVRLARSTILNALTLQAGPGSCTALVGPSGCGKTTLLRVLGGLIAPSAGTIAFPRCEGTRPTTAFCFQEPRLLPWLNARDNVALPLRLQGVSATVARLAALEALDFVALGGHGDKHPHELSGGMQMRVGLARALILRPQLLLLDEPFAAVDELRRAALDQELRRLWETLRMTVVLVTHSAAEAAFVAERVCVLPELATDEAITPADGVGATKNASAAATSTQLIEISVSSCARDTAFRSSPTHLEDVGRITRALHGALR